MDSGLVGKNHFPLRGTFLDQRVHEQEVVRIWHESNPHKNQEGPIVSEKSLYGGQLSSYFALNWMMSTPTTIGLNRRALGATYFMSHLNLLLKMMFHKD